MNFFQNLFKSPMELFFYSAVVCLAYNYYLYARYSFKLKFTKDDNNLAAYLQLLCFINLAFCILLKLHFVKVITLWLNYFILLSTFHFTVKSVFFTKCKVDYRKNLPENNYTSVVHSIKTRRLYGTIFYVIIFMLEFLSYILKSNSMLFWIASTILAILGSFMFSKNSILLKGGQNEFLKEN